MALQSDQLTMTGLGLAVAGQIEAGIHLRWTMDAALGFPRYGFDLYRREHVPGRPECAQLIHVSMIDPYRFISGDLACSADLPISLQDPYGPDAQPALVVDAPTRIVVTCASPMRAFSVRETHLEGTVHLAAYDGLRLVDTATIAAPGGAAAVRGDSFNQVVITTEGLGGFYALCRVIVADSEKLDWGEPLVSLRLPQDWATASRRIPAALHPRYQLAFPQLREVIGLLDRGPTRYTATGPQRPRPTFLVQPVQLLLLGALDPAIARMLGLYYLDATADRGTAYDYLVVGRWTSPRAFDHAWICFDLQRGTPAPVPTPTGLAAKARSVSGGTAPAPAVQVAAALAWDLPRDGRGGLDRGAPVLYHVHRRRRDPQSWGPPVQLTEGKPVAVPPRVPPPRVPEGTLPEAYYVDGPVPAGDYRYQVQGIDLFGRTSAPSAPAEVSLVDRTPPPPPVNVTASPVLPRARTDEADVAVSWEWPPERRAQATDATAFRVVYQTEQVRAAGGTVLGVDDLGDGTSNVFTDLEEGGDYGRFTGGRLINRGRVFPVRRVGRSSRGITVRVANLVDAAGNPVLPTPAGPDQGREALVFVTRPGAAQGRFVLQVDWSQAGRWQPAGQEVPVTDAERYAITLPRFPLATGPLTPVAYALVGVATVDRAGNLGPVSTPVTVAVAHAVPPARPAPLAGGTGGAEGAPQYATRADYHGRSRYTLAIDPTESGLHYDVYRALDAAILALAGAAGPLPQPVTDADLLALADQHEDAFTRLETRAATGTPLTGTGGPLTYTDSLPGTGRNRFVYKVQAVDRAGNRSPMSAGLVVHLIDVVPPRPPVVTRVTGGDRRITLHWTQNREADLALYRLYRTGDAAAGADVRGMPLVAAFFLDTASPRPAGATAALIEDGAGQLAYTDPDVPGQAMTYYRLVAVDRAGNASPASRLVQGRAYDASRPAPPAWNPPTESTTGLALTWTSPDAALACLVHRRVRGEATWSRLSPWLARGAYAYTDARRETGITYEYQLTVMDAAGRTNAEFAVLEW